MKKIDLHIHTIPTFSDAHFDFNLETFKTYVREMKIDAVAITNHDIFDLTQFKLIDKSLGCTVFPGIEINLENGHILVIDDVSNLDEFEIKTKKVSQKIKAIGDCLSFEELEAIFGNLSKYLVIPHYDKKPSINNQTLEKMKSFISAGEVDSAKKFVRLIKDNTKLTPVLFSDVRIRSGMASLPVRQTYVDCGEISLNSLKLSLQDKTKVALSETDGNKLWQVFEDGQMLSTGLNILIGERSSGKTHTLNVISSSVENVKYIKQFSLVQHDDSTNEKAFKSEVERKRSNLADEYLVGFKNILDDIMNVNLVSNDREVEGYVDTLIKSAIEADREDAFSKTTLYSEVSYPIGQFNTLKELIESVRQVIENIEFRSTIEKHLEIKSLKNLELELIKLLWQKVLENSKKKLVNEIIRDVKLSLKIRSSATQVEDVDLYKIALDRKRVTKFIEITNYLKKEQIINEESIQGFRIETKKEQFRGAGEIKTVSGRNLAFSEAFKKYTEPYEYLQQLLDMDLTRSELYKFFIKINYRILNKDGFEVSGGERSEFRLLQEISDAQNYDLLLIDEPESSFDNLFLNTDVNHVLKEISEVMPIVVVTHNSTVGASAGSDYILYTKKETEGGKPVYRLYSGYPLDRKLFSVDGRSINSHEILLNSLEAGEDAYNKRRIGYEAIKN